MKGMTTAAVTGATGFIGLHLAEALLARGYAVRALVRATSKIERLQAIGVETRTIRYDDRTGLQSAIAGADVVFHVAGRIRAVRPTEFYAANEQVTANLAEACATQTRPPKFLFVSSVAAAGPT